MSNIENTLKKLTAYRQKDKFASSEWTARGLYPSDAAIVTSLTQTLNKVVDGMIEKFKSQQTPQELSKSLVGSLNTFKATSYDTEEWEFIVDCIYEVAAILGIDIEEEMDKWMDEELNSL